MVSVESGIGWVPFMLEAMDYELQENAPEYAKKLKKAAARSTSATTGTRRSGSKRATASCRT